MAFILLTVSGQLSYFVRCEIGRFLVSSLTAIGSDNALVGGMVVDGTCCVGDSVTTPGSMSRDKVQEIQFYGRQVERVEQGLSAGLVVTLSWAKALTLESEIHVESGT